MITTEILQQIARERQTSLFPNIVREYAQHLFLSELYQLPGSEKLLFKGGTALRIIYNSPRFSEDLDFSLFTDPHAKPQEFVENLFVGVLARMEKSGIHVELGNKSEPTSGGYFDIRSCYPFELLRQSYLLSEKAALDLRYRKTVWHSRLLAVLR